MILELEDQIALMKMRITAKMPLTKRDLDLPSSILGENLEDMTLSQLVQVLKSTSDSLAKPS